MKATTKRVWLKRLLYVGAGALFLWAVVPAGSIPALVERMEAPPEHIVMSNSEGHAIDPTGNSFCRGDSRLCLGRHVPIWLADYDELGQGRRPSVDEYLDLLFAKLREHSDTRNGGTRKVLIFVHGGLNGQRMGIRRAARLSPIIKEAPDHYYPIFLNWDSSFFSGYYDYLFHVRQGTYYPIWHPKSWGLAPFYFAADVVRGVMQAPMLWFSELTKTEPEEWLQENVSARITLPGGDAERNYARVGQELRARYAENPHGNVIAISQEKDQQRVWPEQLVSSATWFLTLPFKIVLAPFLEALSESSWQMNMRRTRVLFQTNEEFGEAAGADFQPPSGAFALFLNRLVREVRSDHGLTPSREWEITLVGHSMGTIVLNEALRRVGVVRVRDQNGTYQDQVLPVKHIVYMAAACTIRDYEDSVFPYLERHGQARIYHLTLHEEAEERERVDLLPYVDPLPRGSMLIWLDDFMSQPETDLDRRLGNFANLMLAVHDTPEHLRRQISIKAFGAGATVPAPQKHSEFVEKLIFWNPDCWKPSDQVLPECFNADGHY